MTTAAAPEGTPNADAPDAAPTTRRRAVTRARLLAAAGEVFAERGLHGATVDDVVAAAGFTRGAFYSNFSTKEELFYELFEAESGQMVALVRDEVETATGPLDLDVVGAVLARLHPQGRTWYLLQTEFLLHALRDAEGGRRYLELSTRFDGELSEVLRRALERLGRRPTVPIEQVTSALSALYLRRLAVEAVEDAAGGEAPATDGTFLEQILPAVLLGLSEPVD